FDPSHIITIAALMEGGNESSWQKGQERLRQLKPSVVAFFSTDAQSQDLMKTGQAPVQVMLSVNAYHLQEQGVAVKVVQPADFPASLGGLSRSSRLEFRPGSLAPRGFSLANLRAVVSAQYLGYVWDTVVLSAATTVLTLVASYPVAYALARTPSRATRSWLL